MSNTKKSISRKKITPKETKHIPFFVIKIILILVIISLCSGVTYFGLRKFFTVQTQKKIMILSSQITQVAELTALKNNYSDVVCIKKNAAGGMAKSYSIIKYEGVIRAGIRDTSKITFSVMNNKKIKVHIPHTEILGNGLLSQKLFDEKKSIFVPISTQEIFDEIERGMVNTEDKLIQSDFLNEADVQIQKIISTMLTACGYEHIVFY